jgi:4-hydroxy-3-polyprenylbenzoate decarboxylase
MAYPTLRDFVEALDDAGELHRVTARVSPLLEAGAIADRVSKSPAPGLSEHAEGFDPQHHHLGGRALLFEQVQDSTMPLAMNLYGSYRRMEMALGCVEGGFGALADRIERIARPQPPVTLVDKLKKVPELMQLASYPPRVVRSGLCQQVVIEGDAVNLLSLPFIKCWPHDGDPSAFGYSAGAQRPGDGRYVTFGQMYTIDPEDAGRDGPRPSRNIGMYRAQILDERRTVMHWHIHHDGARHWRAWKRLGRPMPLAIAFGGESVLPYAATAPMPPGISELLLAGFLNGRGIELVGCRTVDLHVPAHAELVIEGHVSTECGGIGFDPRRHDPSSDEALGPGAAFEGPFGDHTGFYSLPDRYPIFEVTAITHRRDPIIPATIVGPPPMEDYYLGKATERLFLPLLRTLVPDVIDYDLPMFGAFHNCAFLKIHKEYPLQARRVMHAIWGAGQMAWTKMLVVVDEDVDVHDHEAVLFRLCAHCDPARDIEQVHGPVDILDHAAPHLGAGTKIGFDATCKMPGEEVGGHPVRDYPQPLVMSEEVRKLIERRWGEYGLE